MYIEINRNVHITLHSFPKTSFLILLLDWFCLWKPQKLHDNPVIEVRISKRTKEKLIFWFFFLLLVFVGIIIIVFCSVFSIQYSVARTTICWINTWKQFLFLKQSKYILIYVIRLMRMNVTRIPKQDLYQIHENWNETTWNMSTR